MKESERAHWQELRTGENIPVFRLEIVVNRLLRLPFAIACHLADAKHVLLTSTRAMDSRYS
jgi:hypothetical protein